MIKMLRYSALLLAMFLILGGCYCQAQVFFDDGPSQPQRSRPQGGFGNQGFNGNQNPNNNGFGGNPNNNNNNNNGFGNQNFRNPNQGFGNNNQNPNQNPNQGFGNNQNQNPNQGSGNNQIPNQGFGNNNQNQFQQLQQSTEQPSSRQPDCRTFNNHGGLCTPLASCERIGRMLRNRPAGTAARILSRSICGFDGFLPNVCCPINRQQSENNFLGNGNNGNSGNNGNNGNNGNVNGGGFGNSNITPTPVPRPSTTAFSVVTSKQTLAPVLISSPTKTPDFGSGGSVTLIPPKSTTSSSGGGLIIIGGGPNPTPGSSSTPGLSAEGLPDSCGFSNASHTRIVGGRAAEKGGWPWIAALGYKDEAGNINYLCGGALISDTFVVTASHCIYKRNDLFSVRLGDHDIFTDSDGVVPLNVEVAQIIQHPKYDPGTFYNDIALIRLKQPVPFTRQVHPICLPSTKALRNERFESNTPFVAGWGAVQFNGPSSSVLQEVQIPVVSDSICQEKFKSFKSVNVDDTNICAGLQAGGKDSCSGDSGGPLMQPVGANKYVLIGVVSFGFKCAEPGFPGVYSRVTTHLDWIEKTIQGTS